MTRRQAIVWRALAAASAWSFVAALWTDPGYWNDSLFFLGFMLAVMTGLLYLDDSNLL